VIGSLRAAFGNCDVGRPSNTDFHVQQARLKLAHFTAEISHGTSPLLKRTWHGSVVREAASRLTT
jgi:hypothetical protein